MHTAPSYSTRRLVRGASLISLGLLLPFLVGCVSTGPVQEQQVAAVRDVQDLYIIDCLLPGQVRRVGGATYLSPRRPIRTTTVDCRIRGGEYVSHDRADYRTALNVWLERAQAGEAEAQTYVGEIFEKGLGVEPDYVAAAAWYRRAAEQGHARAQINLGFLYEHGLGVERNSAIALNWYRRASGLGEDELVLRSEFEGEIDELRAQVARQLEESERQSAALRNQLNRLRTERDNLQQQLRAAQQAAAARERDQAQQRTTADTEPRATERQADELAASLANARSEIEILESLFQRTDREREELRAQLAQLPQQRSLAASAPALVPIALPEQNPATFAGINFGRYYALIIGNQDYRYIDPLVSPLNDAERVRNILEQRYGFRTIFLPNADKQQILSALNDLYEQIRPEDNLLVYYAGHGHLSMRADGRRQQGYWLPVDAEEERLARWINNAVISDHIDRIRARSVLVLADSCFAGALASDSSALLLGSIHASLTPESIHNGLSRRARVVISSGGTSPVLDTLDGEHSLFANALIEALESNQNVLRENMLFAKVAVNVRRRSADMPDPQNPEMRPIRAAGHEGGEFFFVPVASR